MFYRKGVLLVAIAGGFAPHPQNVVAGVGSKLRTFKSKSTSKQYQTILPFSAEFVVLKYHR